MKSAAIVLSGGSGRRMGADVKKQYMLLADRPLIFYALKAFEESFTDSVVLVCSPGDEEYCRKEIAERYGFKKITAIVPGGKERYHSVMAGMEAVPADAQHIFIHDGARPFITEEMLERLYEDVKLSGACAAAVPVKDTIKTADDEGFVTGTPKRSTLWQIQTPQVFSAALIRGAYEQLKLREAELLAAGVEITDDAMIAELLTDQRVHLVRGSYDNIKLTTPEDISFACWRLAQA
ncbi:MAG: 2-C-methyl-D-erythritol 4-phosphate cytidylyltransferase [Lachnospiraceae bacterium]|nr:2-C-methyl-D-erythritol 4-phosphate cytidylyltransferase [Lachnospiraceae bacterium]